MTRITGTLHEDRHKFSIISRSVLLRMTNIPDKPCRDTRNTHFVFSNFFFRKLCLFEITWKYILEPDRPHVIMQSMRIACWILKVTDIHSQYAILIAFPLQHLLHERASILRCTYRVIQNDCRGFNNLSYTIHLRQQYIVAPMDQEILKVFFYDVRCTVVMYLSAWSAVY